MGIILNDTPLIFQYYTLQIRKSIMKTYSMNESKDDKEWN